MISIINKKKIQWNKEKNMVEYKMKKYKKKKRKIHGKKQEEKIYH